jgi:methyl-accepting chemotaxis protein
MRTMPIKPCHIISGTLLAASNAGAWLVADISTNSIGVLVTAISLVGGALIGIGIQVGNAWLTWRAKADEQFKASLSGQIEELNTSLKKARETQHQIRNDAQNQAMRHALDLTRHSEEVARLNDQLGLAVEQLKETNKLLEAARVENARLVAVVGKVDQRVSIVNAKVEETKKATGENKEAIQDLKSDVSGINLAIVVDPPQPP